MSDSMIEFKSQVPLIDAVDVLIVGGGPAGLAAASAASRQGSRVFLAEAASCFGGLGTAGLVPAFMQFTDGVHFLAGGIGREIFDRLARMGNKTINPYSIQVEVLKRLYDEMMIEDGVQFRFESRLIGIEQTDGRVTHGIFAGKTDWFAVAAKVVIDATGDALVCHMAGSPCEKGDDEGKMMAGTLCSIWSGIDWSRVKRPDNREIERAFADGVFTVEDRHLPGIWHIGQTLGGGNIGHSFDVDGTDEVSLTRALIHGRKLLTEYEQYYKKYLTGYEDMELVVSASMMGIRETRRIKGDYVLNLQDFYDRAVFADEIGRYAYPVDIHASKSDRGSFDQFLKDHTELRYKNGESYGIPYRCLIPAGLENVLTAGRCVSTDRYMQSSIRVMPGCYITGQAAGVAAAMAASVKTDEQAGEGDVRAVDVAELQRRLLAMGGYLPNSQKG